MVSIIAHMHASELLSSLKGFLMAAAYSRRKIPSAGKPNQYGTSIKKHVLPHTKPLGAN